MSSTTLHFCKICHKYVYNSTKRRSTHPYINTNKQICQVNHVHLSQLSKNVCNLLIKPGVQNSSVDAVKSFYTIVQKEADAWVKDVNPEFKKITTSVFNIYQAFVNKRLTFNLDPLLGLELLIGEYLYHRLSSCHPFFALAVMSNNFPMKNVLDALNTTFDNIRSFSNTRGTVVSSNPSHTTIYDAINDVYDSMKNFSDIVLLNCMFAYESEKLNKYDNQKFETYDLLGNTFTKTGYDLRLTTAESFLESFKQNILVNYVIDEDIIINSIRTDILNELVLYVINRMLGTFYFMGETSSFEHGNILVSLYPQF